MSYRVFINAIGLFVAAISIGCNSNATTPAQPWSTRMADSIITRHPRGAAMELDDAGKQPKWSYSTGFAVYAVAQVGVTTGNSKYIDYARAYMIEFVNDRGAITTPTYDPEKFKLDDVAPGRILLLLHRHDKDDRWLKAANVLADQLRRQPRTADGGFWHKQIYPHQMWLDGIFMDCPFMSDYGRTTNDPRWFDEAARQIVTIAKHTHDPKTGLYYHGWDESRSQRWADKTTGLSQCFWGRAVGWYIMGIVGTLELMPADHPRRAELIAILKNLADAIARVQDAESGVWHQVLDQPKWAGNYLESSASCMFVYAIAKAIRLGYLDSRHAAIARRGYDGILKQFVETDPQTGLVTLKDTCKVAGLGGNPYRDGSFEYYMSEPRIANDPKGLAPFILASLEMER